MDESINSRKEKLLSFIKQKKLWIIGVLIIILILGLYIRFLPMQIHPGTGNPGLWDITTNSWTLGPDLDPWLFERYAKLIVEGGLPEIDNFRTVPLGFDTSTETRLLPYMIAGTYWFLDIFSSPTIEYAAVIFPVIMFGFTIIAFFLFVREIFTSNDEKQKTKASIIALISTFFMIVIPVFLSRTVAGIPEKESAGFFFMFIAFYFFLRAWKSDRGKYILGSLAGISTGVMALVWGGVIYVLIAISLATFIAFIFNKVGKKEMIIFSLWTVFSYGVMILFSGRFSFKALLMSVDTALGFMVLFILIVDYLIWNTKIKNNKFLEKIKLPRNITSLIIAIALGLIFGLLMLGPNFVLSKLKSVYQILIKPITGRWNTTVAENRQPYFTEWGASFGPFIKNIPILFWLFFAGSIVLFKKMFNKIKKKEAWILTGLYALFFFGLVFSRYAPHPYMFDGENFISMFFYYGSALLLISAAIYFYIKNQKQGNNFFEQVKFEYIFLFVLFILCLFTARSAVRLIMVLAPIAPIFVAFLIVESISKFKKAKDDTWKIVLGIFIILLLALSLYALTENYKSIKYQSRGMIPSSYNQQWQKAMAWVRETPESSVFSHWWDYGYWVQSIGNRATVLDGGNIVTYWNYLMGRHVLTGDNQDDALEFLYNHNASYLLIDSTDIGKYGAFSSIGSDESLDRYSWIPLLNLDNQQTIETAEGYTRVYSGGVATDEDIIYEKNGTKIFLPGQKSAMIGIIVDTKENNESFSIKQVNAVFYYQGKQYFIPLRYAYIDGKFIDFGEGLKGTVRFVQSVYRTSSGWKSSIDALIYISPRVMRGFFAQKYLLNDPFGNFQNFKLEHTENALIVDAFRANGINADDFIFYDTLYGPIKIWKINYTGKEKVKQEYLDTDPSKYLNWEL